MKALAKPPMGVKIVCEAVCVMLGIKPVRIPDPEDPSKRIMDFWGPSQKMLGEADFIAQLKGRGLTLILRLRRLVADNMASLAFGGLPYTRA